MLQLRWSDNWGFVKELRNRSEIKILVRDKLKLPKSVAKK